MLCLRYVVFYSGAWNWSARLYDPRHAMRCDVMVRIRGGVEELRVGRRGRLQGGLAAAALGRHGRILCVAWRRPTILASAHLAFLAKIRGFWPGQLLARFRGFRAANLCQLCQARKCQEGSPHLWLVAPLLLRIRLGANLAWHGRICILA